MQLLSKNIVGALLILMLLAFLYTSLISAFKEIKEISLSELVGKINAGEVAKIIVRDSDLDVTLKDNSELRSKKENEAALSETFKNYGVAEDKLRAVSIDVKNPDGILYWLGVSLPFLLPFLLIVAFFWMTARQVQRANIQAFTFGQSRARIIYPNNTKERVLFKDVAGGEEAKEEMGGDVYFF